MAFCNTGYFEQIEKIQKDIHEREKRRHELEEKLFAYLRSEERLTKIKCAKMRCYYKELHDREQQAKTRNLELLGNVESLAGKLKEFSIDCSRLLQKRIEYKNHITRLKKGRKKMESRGESEANEQSSRFLLPTTCVPSQTTDIFMGHLTPNKSREDGVITTRSPSWTELKPNHPSLSPPQSLLQSAILMQPHVSKAKDAAVLSNDIINSGDCLEGGRMGDVQQMESDSDISRREGKSCRREDLNSARTALKEAEVSSRSVTLKRPAAVVSLERCPTHSPSPDTTDPRDSSQYGSSRGEDEPLSAEDESESAIGHQNLSDLAKSRHPSIPSPAVESRPDPSVHKESDISVLPPERYQGDHTLRDDTVNRESVLPIQSNNGTQEQFGRPDPLEPSERLSLEGLCNLLDSIERRLAAKDMSIYQSCTVSEQKLRDVISKCSESGHLDDVDLQACGAVILQQLPLLCSNLPQGCLLSSDLINTHWSSATKPDQIRSYLSGEVASLWDRCFKHMLHLQQQEVLSTDLTVQIFTPLLVLNNATYTDKARELLKRLLTYESDTHQPSQSEEMSSYSLPSLLDDSVEIKPARPLERFSQTAETQEIQSAEEDSADQSPVESIPIRETKAYQLLKQSVTQERRWSDPEEEDSESSDINKLERAEALGDSITQNSRKNAKSKVHVFSAVQSKAFWGESDDSNSEIEMALRPQSRKSSTNDFDDFYD
nr:centrosomal protein kizuna isoform X1 [Misgurnus anguillicaudatus]